MRPEDLLDAMGELDDEILLAAKEKQKSKKPFIYSAAAVAACFIILAGTVFNPTFRLANESLSADDKGAAPEAGAPEAGTEEICGNSSDVQNAEDVVLNGNIDNTQSSLSGSISVYPIPEATEEEKAFAIFYVAEGETEKSEWTLPGSPYAVFEKWKEMHGIGDEVELIDLSAATKPSVESYYYGSECIVQHTSDGIMCLNITISQAISHYYDVFGEEKLISSLKKTMEGYTGRHFDEINVILK